jgi:sugar lactone lactonase YvrE
MGSSIQKVNAAGIISTVAGGKYGYSGDGGPATSAALGALQPYNGVAIDPAGNLYISDDYNHAIRMVSAATGIITTIAGNGSPGFAGDGGPASKAQFFYPAGICFDSAGNLYIADEFNYRVRKVDTAGIISTVAGNGNAVGGAAVDGVQATTTAIETPLAVTVDSAGNLYIAEGNILRKATESAR